MTVTTPVARNDYTGAGSAGPFVYGFRIYLATDLVVTTQDPSGNVATVAYPGGYTVTGVGSRSGGTITLTTALAVGWKMTIQRVRPLTQLINYRNQGAGFPANIEDGFDQLVMIAQQLQSEIGQAVTVPITTGPGSAISSFLPSYYLRVNLAGTGVEGVTQVVAAQNFLQSGTGAVVRSANSKMGEIISVKDFGAKGDGATDDWASCNAASTQAASLGGGTVYFPPGVYMVSQAIPLRANVALIGDDWNTVIRATPGSTDNVIGQAYPGGAVSWVRIENLSIEGNNSAILTWQNDDAYQNGIRLNQVSFSKLRNLRIAHTVNNGLSVYNASTDNEVTGCFITDIGKTGTPPVVWSANGIFNEFGASRNVYTNNRVLSCRQSCFWITSQGADTHDVSVLNNYFEGPARDGGANDTCRIFDASGASVTWDTRFIGNRLYGIATVGQVTLRINQAGTGAIHGTHVAQNIISDCDYAVENDTSATYTMIHSNYFRHCLTQGIFDNGSHTSAVNNITE